MQYEVTVVIDASHSATVEADSPAEAADRALEEHGFPSICHQCAGELNVGDAVGAIVYDSECETQLLDTTYHGERIAELEAEIARLRAAPTPPAQTADSVLEEAVGLLEELAEHDSYSTEYDGRMISLCPECGEQEGEHRPNCAFVRAKTFLAARKQGGAT